MCLNVLLHIFVVNWFQSSSIMKSGIFQGIPRICVSFIGKSFVFEDLAFEISLERFIEVEFQQIQIQNFVFLDEKKYH